MRLNNETFDPAIAFRQFAPNGSLDCVVSVRACFHHRQDQPLGPPTEAEPLQYDDLYDGDPHTGVLLKQGDLVPEKPGTDVTFLGSSYAPGGKPAKSWQAAIRVSDRLEKRLLVSGPRTWQPETKAVWAGFKAREPKRRLTGWTLSEPEPVTKVDLTWHRSFGGSLPKTGEEDEPADVHRSNPIGPGLLLLEHGDADIPVPAHQIDDADAPVTDWKHHGAAPHGFGPIPPWWHQRQQFAGTYDDAWREERHPLLPRDFDTRFWQCAHPDLIACPHLQGNEAYELVNLHPHHETLRGTLPDMVFGVHVADADRESAGWHKLRLDGLHFDFRDGRELVVLTYRCRFPLNEPERAVLTLRSAKRRKETENSHTREAAE